MTLGRTLRAALALSAVMLAGSLAGCQTASDVGGALLGSGAKGAEAPLKSVRSAVDGSVRFVERGGGVTVLVHLTGLVPGPHRIAIHANGNCSSPNAFSAGPVWDAPGAGPQVLSIFANSERTATLTRRIAGLHVEGTDGLVGRSVVVHAGSQASLDTRPDVPNARIACGVIGSVQTLF